MARPPVIPFPRAVTGACELCTVRPTYEGHLACDACREVLESVGPDGELPPVPGPVRVAMVPVPVPVPPVRWVTVRPAPSGVLFELCCLYVEISRFLRALLCR